MNTTRHNVSTSAFRFSHGHEPRGRGWWVFEMTGEAGRAATFTATAEAGTGRAPTFTAARAEAVRFAAANRMTRVTVGS
jgi:hypothetical protein